MLHEMKKTAGHHNGRTPPKLPGRNLISNGGGCIGVEIAEQLYDTKGAANLSLDTIAKSHIGDDFVGYIPGRRLVIETSVEMK